MADEIDKTDTIHNDDKLIAQAPIKDGAGSAGPSAHPAGAEHDTNATSNENPASQASTAQSIMDGASKLAKQATEKARDYVAEGKSRAGGALDEVSRLMGDAATTVDEKLGAQYGQYARTAAEGIADFSESLKAKEIDDLMADAQNFVRKSPAVAIGIAAALGFVLVRLVKAGLDPADAPAGHDANAAGTAPTSDA